MGTEKNILVNSIAPGFIDTSMSIMKDGKLHKRGKK